MIERSDNIYLEEETHRYVLLDDPDFTFTSCTTFVGQFFEKFDKEAIALHLVNNHPNYAGLSVENLVATWNNLTREGTRVHAEIEHFLTEGKPVTHPKAMHALEWLRVKNIIPKKMLPEFILYSKELGIAGTIDLLVMNIDGSYDIYDWKTSKKIEMNPYRGKRGILGPALDVGDCNFNHYSLQLSLYQYILETYYGLKIRYTVLYHLNGVQVVPYRSDYWKDVIEDMLAYSLESSPWTVTEAAEVESTSTPLLVSDFAIATR